MGTITDEECARRQKAVNFGWANSELEGFVATLEDIEHGQRFLRGKLTLAEFVDPGRQSD